MKKSWTYYKHRLHTDIIYRTDGEYIEVYLDLETNFKYHMAWFGLPICDTLEEEISARQLIEIPNEEAFVEII
tara:strand:- start:426 stop:644 length:219 start_codon:yes stop_codon:yes gene_type:complete